MAEMPGPAAAPATSPVIVPGPAKLNLYLHVLGRRADGFHLLDSLIAFASAGDVIEADTVPDGTLSLDITGPFAGTLKDEPDNLVLRAGRALQAHAPGRPGAHLTLTKNLPVASGIGGGSADAAAALKALGQLWSVEVAPEVLADIALGLGADVPICLHGAPAFVGGIGEEITPAPALPEVPLVLVNPGVAVPTPPVFKARSGPFQRAARFDDAPRDAADLANLLSARTNGLGAAAEIIAPEITEVLGALAAEDGCLLARMSGSGATCFALFTEARQAQAAAQRLSAPHPSWWVAPGTLR